MRRFEDMNSNENSVEIHKPSDSAKDLEASRYYVFSETGNIVVSSTLEPSQPLPGAVQKVFSEVSVFFAAMSRSLTTTVNPATQKPYSLYNYHALKNVIDGSGLFAQVTTEDITYRTEDVGVDFSKALLEALFGFATGTAGLSFASGMLTSIGSEALRMAQASDGTENKVGNIFFLCEYLLGIPVISAIVVHGHVGENRQSLQVGPCFKEQSQSTKWQLHRDTYMFVTPAFIREYAGDLDGIKNDARYADLVGWLSRVVSGGASATKKADTKPAAPALVPSK